MPFLRKWGQDPPAHPEAERILRERRRQSREKISGLTIKILAVNVIAIMILGLGVLYLGQYTDSLIKGELDSLRSEARLFAGAISEGAVRPVFQISPIPFNDPFETEAIRPDLARRMVRRLGEITSSRIRLYDADGEVMADSHRLIGPGGVVQIIALEPQQTDKDLHSVFIDATQQMLGLIPMQTKLPPYPEDKLADVFSFPDTQAALVGNISTSAWRTRDGKIIMTAAAPIQKIKQVMGVVLLIREGSELEKAITAVRLDVFKVFLGSLGLTVILSIYLSGLIGRPLQKLAAAAEAVRLSKGSRNIEIPDMSERHDEIGELSLALRDMTQGLWKRMDMIERFAADVAHEIKNPLTSLRSAVETAARVKDPQSQAKLMEIILHDVQRLDRLISDISSASRLDAELSREEMSSVDLKSLLYQLRDAYRKPLGRAKREKTEEETNIRLELPEGDVKVRGNEQRLGQVFENLISNALSFSPENGFVKVRVQNKGRSVLIQIEDQGPGIPENNLDRIFDRFYTERPEHEDYGSHSGLGLSISKQIMEAHGGRIWAENIKGLDGQVTGARFSLILDAA